LGIDVNFCLKHKNVSSNKADPDLNKGCTYFVEESEYKEYLEVHKADPGISDTAMGIFQKSVCPHYDAVNLAGNCPGKDHAASGTGTIECMWHKMKCSNKVRNLQRGEQFVMFGFIWLQHSTQS
jgi:hypothetical protein